jgi:AcrR family transcriptional regulator
MSSNESAAERGRRRYEQRERARRREETRRRITEAALDLHRQVGPARTSHAEVARRAGVGRMTVYNHFPTETDLIAACSGHWAAQHPLPDIAAWRAIDDPDARLVRALRELYGWYRDGRGMMEAVVRDAPLVPALQQVLAAGWFPVVDAMVDALMAGRRLRGRRAARARAGLRLALEPEAWRVLTDAGLTDDEAAEVAAGMVPGGRPAAA